MILLKVVTTRLEEKYEKDLREIEKEEKTERSVIARKFIVRGINDWKIHNALESLKRREVSIGKAAEMAGVSYVHMLDLMGKENIDIGYSVLDLEKDFARLKKK